jgi:Mg/Co/Ni transporter MgtE
LERIHLRLDESMVGIAEQLADLDAADLAELLWGQHTPLAFTVALTVLVICTWATAVGSLIPIVAERFGVDPAVLSAPLITTLVDATGLVIYFSIAKTILHL